MAQDFNLKKLWYSYGYGRTIPTEEAAMECLRATCNDLNLNPQEYKIVIGEWFVAIKPDAETKEFSIER